MIAVLLVCFSFSVHYFNNTDFSISHFGLYRTDCINTSKLSVGPQSEIHQSSMCTFPMAMQTYNTRHTDKRYENTSKLIPWKLWKVIMDCNKRLSILSKLITQPIRIFDEVYIFLCFTDPLNMAVGLVIGMES